jgi:hypothetical protein
MQLVNLLLVQLIPQLAEHALEHIQHLLRAQAGRRSALERERPRVDSPLEPRGRRRVQPLDALTSVYFLSASGRTRRSSSRAEPEGRGGRGAAGGLWAVLESWSAPSGPLASDSW